MKTITFTIVLLGLLQNISASSSSDDRKFSVTKKICMVDETEGTCMFHYDCQSQNGQVLGTCMDGFLFGVCCLVSSDEAMTSMLGMGLVDKPISSDPIQLVGSIIASLNQSSLNLSHSGDLLSGRIPLLPNNGPSFNILADISNATIDTPVSSNPESGELASHLDDINIISDIAPIGSNDLNTTFSNQPDVFESDAFVIVEVLPNDIENMMHSILDNVLSEFDSNVEPLLNLLADEIDEDILKPMSPYVNDNQLNYESLNTQEEAAETSLDVSDIIQNSPSMTKMSSTTSKMSSVSPESTTTTSTTNTATTTINTATTTTNTATTTTNTTKTDATTTTTIITTTPTTPTTTNTTSTTATTQTTKSSTLMVTKASTSSTSTPSLSTTAGNDPNLNYKADCGVRPLRGYGRIVGGERTIFGDWPWQVLVKESTWLGLFTKNKCGGVLISDRHVLTAAHCQPGFLASLLVELGEHDLTGPTEHMATMTKKVKRVVIHKDYKAPTFENDIAILELETPIDRKPHIVPICLPDIDEVFEGRTAIVTGWGRLEYGGSVPNVLQQVSVPIMNNDKCQKMFTRSGHKKTVRESFLCAGYDLGKKDSCEGDSGGPLMIQQPDSKWILAGTVSHGIKCAYPDLPGVYMRMTYYKPWIEKVTGLRL